MSPGYDSVKYPNYQVCRWNITEPNGKSMQLKFEDFEMGDDKDFVEVSLFFKYLELPKCILGSFL